MSRVYTVVAQQFVVRVLAVLLGRAPLAGVGHRLGAHLRCPAPRRVEHATPTAPPAALHRCATRSFYKLYLKQQETVAVLGFPANDFMFQERGSDSDIADFCEKNYNPSTSSGYSSIC